MIYIRYVDDLILLHENKNTLLGWKAEIEEYLKRELKLELHPHRQIFRPISNGIDFLGYIVRPSHLLIRKRIAARCKDSLNRQTRRMMRRDKSKTAIYFPPEEYMRLQSTINSYLGAFSHASCHSLSESMICKNSIIKLLFCFSENKAVPRWLPTFKPANLPTQYRYFRARFTGLIFFQVGCYFEMFDRDAVWASENLGLSRIRPRKGFYARCGFNRRFLKYFLKININRNVMIVFQTDKIHGRVCRRMAIGINFPICSH